ncbi:unnamed protein product [Amoebophrya sp. A120]|nr:unnamed protein product [Amoebophrya sp. A120]|eukprot:GSA120T00006573001.1
MPSRVSTPEGDGSSAPKRRKVLQWRDSQYPPDAFADTATGSLGPRQARLDSILLSNKPGNRRRTTDGGVRPEKAPKKEQHRGQASEGVSAGSALGPAPPPQAELSSRVSGPTESESSAPSSLLSSSVPSSSAPAPTPRQQNAVATAKAPEALPQPLARDGSSCGGGHHAKTDHCETYPEVVPVLQKPPRIALRRLPFAVDVEGKKNAAKQAAAPPLLVRKGEGVSTEGKRQPMGADPASSSSGMICTATSSSAATAVAPAPVKISTAHSAKKKPGPRRKKAPTSSSLDGHANKSQAVDALVQQLYDKSNTLKLSLKWEPFACIYAGIKRKEYRDVSSFMESRLFADAKEKVGRRRYDFVEFLNGRNSTAPFMKLEYRGFEKKTVALPHTYDDRATNGKACVTIPPGTFYVIHLGDLLETRNVPLEKLDDVLLATLDPGTKQELLAKEP